MAWEGEYRVVGTLGTEVVGQSRPRVQGTRIVYWARATHGSGPGAPKMPHRHGKGAMPGRATPLVHREQVGSETASGSGGAIGGDSAEGEVPAK